MEPLDIPKEIKQKDDDPKTLRTYQSDLAEAIKNQQGSVIKIAMAEQEKKQRDDTNKNPTSKKNLTFIFTGGALILVAIGVIMYFVATSKPKTVPITQSQTLVSTLVKTDSSKIIKIDDLTKEELGKKIADEYKSATPALNTIEQIQFVEENVNPNVLITTERFWDILDTHIPGELLRSFNPIFTLGIHAWSKNGLFIMMKTNSYSTAFAGMLKWETTLLDDLYRIFGIDTAGENSALFSAKWKDMVLKNQDTRVLTDSVGNIVLFYTFLGENKDTLFIGDKEQTLVEVVNRMTANTIRQ